MAHVLVVPYPSQGHMNPMVQFARKLASKGGVAVTMVTTRYIARTTLSGGRGLDAGPGVRVEAISDGHDKGGVASAASLEEYLATLDAAGAASLTGLVAAAAEERGADRLPFTCVVYDTFAPWAGRVARDLGLQAVAFSTQSCTVSAVYHYVHEGKLAVPPPEPASTRSPAFAGLPEMERRELPSFVLGDGPYPTLAVFALSQFADAGRDDWVLFNSFDELESEVTWRRPRHARRRRGRVAHRPRRRRRRGARRGPLPFTCVVYDTFAPWAGRVARDLGLQAVAFSTQSCTVSAVYHYVHEGKLAVPPPEPASTRSPAFAGLPEMERRELPSFVLGDGPYPTLAVFALSQFADAGRDDWVLFNSFDELESEVLAGLSTQWKARAIGPCVPLPVAGAGDGATGRFTYGANLLDPEDTCMQWLDTKPPSSVAYVSFGSFASLCAAQTEELARGLLAVGKPFLWVVRATEEAQLPHHLLDAATASGDALVVRWSPQLDVLAHRATGCFVTHCGWNSTLEALGFGVPMVALPLWTDQPTNALLVERAWGAGVRARRDDAAGMFLRGEIERCVRDVMEQEESAGRARSEAWRWSDAARAAVSPGGSSDRSLDEFVEFLRGGSGAGADADAGEKWKALVREGSDAAASEM
uniref:Uncharacterized protein n=1 Tax=Oryza punctata TaxID=4537 RepID=A0A0E0KHQ4_ORYPU